MGGRREVRPCVSSMTWAWQAWRLRSRHRSADGAHCPRPGRARMPWSNSMSASGLRSASVPDARTLVLACVLPGHVRLFRFFSSSGSTVRCQAKLCCAASLARAWHVRCHHAVASCLEDRGRAPTQAIPRWLAVQAQPGQRRIARPVVQQVQAQASETGQVIERCAALRSATLGRGEEQARGGVVAADAEALLADRPQHDSGSRCPLRSRQEIVPAFSRDVLAAPV